MEMEKIMTVVDPTLLVASVAKCVSNSNKVKEFLINIDNLSGMLKTEVNKENISKTIEYCSECPFSGQLNCTFQSRFTANPQELLNKVSTQEMSYEDMWKTAENLQSYIEDSKLAVVNEEMKNFFITNVGIQIYQTVLLLDNYIIIKNAGKKIENEQLFKDVKDQLDKIQQNIDELQQNNLKETWKMLIVKELKLRKLIKEATEELSRIDKSLVAIDSDLNNVQKTSKMNMIYNFVNFISSTYTMSTCFQSASMTYKVLNSIFGPIGYAFLSIGNAKNYYDSKKMLEDLKVKQDELTKIKQTFYGIENEFEELCQSHTNKEG